MKPYRMILMLVVGGVLFSGCVAFPPLIQVEHKHDAPAPAAASNASNDEVLKRLDAIDQRLNQLEKSTAK